jgi:hypothetical protein|tara:strand:- start:1387 stop:1560 length:174 start_codon:yes stop_codon:yes gene_type:complete
MEDELKKLFLTIPDIYGGYSAVIQVSGFETEKEANDYLIKNHKTEELEILNPDKTIH